MTTELTKAAQQALEQLEFLNACYPHKTAADAIAALQTALTQHPAAQTEREAFEAWWPTVGQTIGKVAAWEAWQFRASLPAPQQATPAEEFKTINCRVNGIDYTGEVRRVDENTVDIGRVAAFADERATPEPVGEPFGYFRALPFEWEQCGEHDEGAVALYTRPAPGVPEGFALVPMEEWEVHDLRARLRQEGVGLNVSVPQLKCVVEAVEARFTEMLAAAQAKGAGQ